VGNVPLRMDRESQGRFRRCPSARYCPDAGTPYGIPVHTADWLVFAAYIAFLGVGGWVVGRKAKDAREYFVGDQGMPAWAVALSVLASALSVASFLGLPEQAYGGNLTFLASNIGTVLAVLFVAWIFVPAFYRERVVTVYDLLNTAFGPRARAGASATFLLGRALASGARLFMAALPAGMIVAGAGMSGTNDHAILIAIALLAALAVVYTLAGGITSIIWTDVAQFAVMIAAVVGAIAVLLMRIPIGGAGIVQALTADKPDVFTVIDTSTDPARVNTLWTSLSGFLLFSLAVYGTDQDLSQRMLTCRNAVAGGASALMAIALNLPVTLLFLTLGLLLRVYYHLPAVMGAAAPAQTPGPGQQAFLVFIMSDLPAGLGGLLLAGLVAVGFTSLLSALNAMAATALNDWYRPLLPGKTDAHYLAAGRWAVAGAGVVLAVVAMGCVYWQRAVGDGLINFALGVMVVPYAGLLGVFLTALLTRRGNEVSAIAALATGMVVTLAMQPWAWPTLTAAWAAMVPMHPLPVKALAYPWLMVVGTGAAFAVCCAGRRRVRAV